jgi:uncharacterized protein (TIGR02217 family)
MAFVETPRFPDNLAYGTQGGPEFLTGVTVLQSGYEQRNTLWSQARHRFDASYAIRTNDDFDLIRDWFHSMRGRWNGFRFKDFFDFSSGTSSEMSGGALTTPPTELDQQIGVGDTVEVDFQLVKNYTIGTETLVRLIQKPVAGTVLIALDTVLQADPGDYSFDDTTGIVTFVSPPGGGVVVTAGYEFDVPVRFENDSLAVSYDSFNIQSASVPMVELLIPLP